MENSHLRILWENDQANSHHNQDKLALQIIAINISNYMEFLVSGYFLPLARYFLKKSYSMY